MHSLARGYIINAIDHESLSKHIFDQQQFWTMDRVAFHSHFPIKHRSSRSCTVRSKRQAACQVHNLAASTRTALGHLSPGELVLLGQRVCKLLHDHLLEHSGHVTFVRKVGLVTHSLRGISTPQKIQLEVDISSL